jgi:hypothetical protein
MMKSYQTGQWIRKYLLFIGLLLSQAVYAQGISNIRKLGKIYKKNVAHLKQKDVHQLVKNAYIQLHLMDDKGEWLSEELREASDRLLPPDLDLKSVNTFINKTVKAASQNPYLINFVNKVKHEDCQYLASKVKEEGNIVLPKSVALAIALDNLTREQLKSTELLISVFNLFREARKNEKIGFKELGLFRWAKLSTVEAPIEKFIEFRKSGVVDPTFTRYFLPVNILEAMAADVFLGNFSNAKSAWPLVKHSPAATSVCDPVLGTGPTTWTPDGKSLMVRTALPKEWADLYTTWNGAFVGQFETSPFVLTKLFIPVVNDYQDHPEQYIVARVFALNSYLHYSVFGEAAARKEGTVLPNWTPDKAIMCLWGKTNKESASDYLQKIEDRKSAHKN